MRGLFAFRACGAALGVCFTWLVLMLVLPTPMEAVGHIRDAVAIGDLTQADRLAGAVAALLLWVLLLWVAAVVFFTIASAIPGVAGTVATWAGQAITPRVLRGTCAVLVGVGIATSGSAAMASPHTTSPSSTISSSPAEAQLSDIQADWPVTGTAPATEASPPSPHDSNTVDAPDTSGASGGSTPSQDTGRTTEDKVNRKDTTQDKEKSEDESTRTVTVQPGDSLWSLAKSHLDDGATEADIHAEWKRWWEKNRDAIGDDPDLIREGTQLRVPSHN